jgi:hypothetical protein
MVQPYICGRKVDAAMAAFMEILNFAFLPLTIQQAEFFHKRLINMHFRCMQIRAECLFQLCLKKHSHLFLHQPLDFFLGAAVKKQHTTDTSEEQHRHKDRLERRMMYGKKRDHAACYTNQTDAQPGARLLLVTAQLSGKLRIAGCFRANRVKYRSVSFHIPAPL